MKLYAKVKKDGKWTFVRYRSYSRPHVKIECECRICQKGVE